MKIQEQSGKFLVVENEETIYEALTWGEAQGFIDWLNRTDAGNPGDCVNCP
jgi:hypothetical protein